jgi:hypothetical protein
MKIQCRLKCPHGRSTAIVAGSPFDVGHDRTSPVGQATGYKRSGKAIDLGFEFANLVVSVGEELTQQERFTGNILNRHS